MEDGEETSNCCALRQTWKNEVVVDPVNCPYSKFALWNRDTQSPRGAATLRGME